jgi:hypothetical protein
VHNMTIKRMAYIIGAEKVASQKPVLGAGVDRKRMVQFLRSEAGGAWKPSEIQTFDRPILVNPHSTIRSYEYDYQVLYFAGHGFAQDGETYLCFDDGQEVPVRALPINAPKALVIIDACRKVIQVPPTLLEKVGGVYAGGLPNPSRRALARWIYDRAIEEADNGISAMFASAYDESAWGTQFGGLFTTSLIKGAQRWAANGSSPVRSVVLSAPVAFQLAANRISPNQQHPEMSAEQLHMPLPFAVRVRP